jgi:hypothetical protein
MIACISPNDTNYEENLLTLNYALKTNNIKNKPVINKDVNSLLIERLSNKKRSNFSTVSRNNKSEITRINSP